jgi:hypothetical protein
VEILYARWEPPNYGYRPPNSRVPSASLARFRTTRDDQRYVGRNSSFLTSGWRTEGGLTWLATVDRRRGSP